MIFNKFRVNIIKLQSFSSPKKKKDGMQIYDVASNSVDFCPPATSQYQGSQRSSIT